jgi:hypothetical protein
MIQVYRGRSPVSVTLAEFLATLRLTWADPDSPGERLFSYWNNDAVTHESCDRAEVLHITRRTDSSFCVGIANILHTGTLEELERVLYVWASEEGWFD